MNFAHQEEFFKDDFIPVPPQRHPKGLIQSSSLSSLCLKSVEKMISKIALKEESPELIGAKGADSLGSCAIVRPRDVADLLHGRNCRFIQWHEKILMRNSKNRETLFINSVSRLVLREIQHEKSVSDRQ